VAAAFGAVHIRFATGTATLESLPSNHTYAPQITSDSPTLCIPFICGERHIAQKKVSLCTFLHMVVLLIP